MEVRIGMHQVDGRTGSATARAVLASFVDAICHNPISLSVATDMPVWAQSKPFRSTAGQLDTLVITARIVKSRLVEIPLLCRVMLFKEALLSYKHGSYSPAIGEKASMPERTDRTLTVLGLIPSHPTSTLPSTTPPTGAWPLSARASTSSGSAPCAAS